MDAIEELEHRCADAWPALVDEPLGQWRLRAADGFTGRANSVLATGDPGVPVPEALRLTCEFAVRHGITPKVQAVLGGRHDAGLTAAGWRVDDAHSSRHGILVLTAPVREGGSRNDPQRSEVLGVPPPGWWPLAVGGERPSAAQRHVLASGPGVGFGVHREGTAVLGAARGVVLGDLLHVGRLAVAQEHRRRGVARELMAALTRWGRRRGARRCVLQVISSNEPALRLYRGLGCTEHHRYRYWIRAAS